MALIKCKKCGQMISDKADKCPKCGCSVSVNEALDNVVVQNTQRGKNNGRSNKQISFVALVCLLVILLGGGIWWSLNNNEEIEAYECFDGDSTLYMAKDGKLQTEKPSRQQSVPQQRYVINSREVNGSKKFGLTDNQGNCILDCTYDKITYLGDDYFLIEDFS